VWQAFQRKTILENNQHDVEKQRFHQDCAMKKASLIAVGSELLGGDREDTNGTWLCDFLRGRGVTVVRRTVVPDDLQAIKKALRESSESSPLVVITGGLGPTQDDLTREALASYCGVPLKEDAAILEEIEAYFVRRGKPMSQRNRVQAQVPQGAIVLKNARGTAPGLAMEHAGCLFVVFPGVPFEMKSLAEENLGRLVESRYGTIKPLIQRTLLLFGAGESEVESQIMDFTRRDRVPEIGITVSEGFVRLKLVAESAQEIAVEQTLAALRSRLTPWIVAERDVSLAQLVIELASTRVPPVRIATAESCTGGLVSHRLTSVSGSSAVFVGGVVSYANQAKEDLLQVPKDVMIRFGAVSVETAKAMAEGVRSRLDSDIAVSITGIAGPTGGTLEKPVGMVCMAVATRVQTTCWTVRLGASRARKSRNGPPTGRCFDFGKLFQEHVKRRRSNRFTATTRVDGIAPSHLDIEVQALCFIQFARLSQCEIPRIERDFVI
jgi:nicotinamide-nucleotide amidase